MSAYLRSLEGKDILKTFFLLWRFEPEENSLQKSEYRKCPKKVVLKDIMSCTHCKKSTKPCCSTVNGGLLWHSWNSLEPLLFCSFRGMTLIPWNWGHYKNLSFRFPPFRHVTSPKRVQCGLVLLKIWSVPRYLLIWPSLTREVVACPEPELLVFAKEIAITLNYPLLCLALLVFLPMMGYIWHRKCTAGYQSQVATLQKQVAEQRRKAKEESRINRLVSCEIRDALTFSVGQGRRRSYVTPKRYSGSSYCRR